MKFFAFIIASVLAEQPFEQLAKFTDSLAAGDCKAIKTTANAYVKITVKKLEELADVLIAEGNKINPMVGTMGPMGKNYIATEIKQRSTKFVNSELCSYVNHIPDSLKENLLKRVGKIVATLDDEKKCPELKTNANAVVNSVTGVWKQAIDESIASLNESLQNEDFKSKSTTMVKLMFECVEILANVAVNSHLCDLAYKSQDAGSDSDEPEKDEL